MTVGALLVSGLFLAVHAFEQDSDAPSIISHERLMLRMAKPSFERKLLRDFSNATDLRDKCLSKLGLDSHDTTSLIESYYSPVGPESTPNAREPIEVMNEADTVANVTTEQADKEKAK